MEKWIFFNISGIMYVILDVSIKWRLKTGSHLIPTLACSPDGISVSYLQFNPKLNHKNKIRMLQVKMGNEKSVYCLYIPTLYVTNLFCQSPVK